MQSKRAEAETEDAPPPYLPPEMEPMTAVYTKGTEIPTYTPVPPYCQHGMDPATYPLQGPCPGAYPCQQGGYTVTQQPLYGLGPPQVVLIPPRPGLDRPPATHLRMAIFVTLCCCWPIGIFAILRSSSCKNAIGRGDRREAERLSTESKVLSMWGLGVGIAFNVLFVAAFMTMYILYVIPSWQF